MKSPPVRGLPGARPGIFVAGMALLALSACAPAMAGSTAPSGEEISRREAKFAADSTDVAAAIDLATAYRAAGRHADAARLMEPVVQREPENGRALFLLGLSYEELQQFTRARELYERYVAVGTSAPLKRGLRWRIPLLRRRELEQAAQVALANEAQLRNQAPTPRTVAVFPFRFASQDSALAPLSRALAAMLVTDLSQTDRLSVLERLQVQVLLDEMQLAEGQLVDPATAARGGQLLGAERIVQGTIQGDSSQLRLDAAVVRADQGVMGTPISEANTLRELFEMETRLALRIYENMGIDLTPAEREAINKRPTENLQAILAYGRGLQAADAGNFEQAARHFSEAAALDPGFTEAAEEAQEAEGLASAELVSTQELARAGLDQADVAAAFSVERLVPEPAGRDVVSEALGTEGLGQRTILEIIIPRP